MAALTAGTLAVGGGADGQASGTLRSARAEAIRGGRRVPFTAHDGSRLLLLPDGRVIGPGVDPLTGESLNDAR